MLWSTTLALHAACNSFPALVTVRTFLGIFEAVCQPTFLILSSMWYKREEQAKVVTWWYMMNGGQQIVGGLLAYCFSLIKSPPSSIKSWQAIFMAYGILSFFWGAFVIWWLPGKYSSLETFRCISDYVQTALCVLNASLKQTRSSW
jgi:MFS family permease